MCFALQILPLSDAIILPRLATPFFESLKCLFFSSAFLSFLIPYYTDGGLIALVNLLLLLCYYLKPGWSSLRNLS